MLDFTLIFVVGVISLSNGELGPCTHRVKTDPNYDLNKFANEKDGKWKFWLVPEQWDALTYLDMDPTGNKDEFRFVMYKNHKGGEPLKFLDGKLKQTEVGKSTFNGEAGGKPLKFEMYFLKYVAKKYAYYYVCSNQEHDLSTDYRYVVTHGPLDENDQKEINNIDKQYNFKGTLKKNEVLDYKGDPKETNKPDDNKADDGKKKH